MLPVHPRAYVLADGTEGTVKLEARIEDVIQDPVTG